MLFGGSKACIFLDTERTRGCDVRLGGGESLARRVEVTLRMWIIWGPTSDVKDLGIVAERCPRCGSVSPCRVVGRSQGFHVYFITLASAVTDAVCTCGSCGAQFRCELWRYKGTVPDTEASALPMETLLERTNPTLKERLGWEQRLAEYGTDPQFTAALRSVEQLMPGGLRKGLMDDLLRWGQINERQRATLVRDADRSAHALQFARSVATRLPKAAGCLVGSLISLAVWSAFLWAPAVRDLQWGALTLLAGAAAGAATWHAILRRRVLRWTKEVLVPESQKAGVDLRQFIAVLGDLPAPGPHSVHELRDLKEQEGTIRQELKRLGEVD
jgi:hypothetical protein